LVEAKGPEIQLEFTGFLVCSYPKLITVEERQKGEMWRRTMKKQENEGG
jgi:hypothetical protein